MANILTPKFRVSYPNVFRAKKNDLSGKDEFSVVALFPKGSDLRALQAAAKEVTVEKWGADKNFTLSKITSLKIQLRRAKDT